MKPVDEVANGLDVKGAVQSIEKALAYEAPLRTRAEGLSWMVWGLVLAVLALVVGGRVDWPLWVTYAIVIPMWAGLGLGGTSAVWRLAGTARPALSISPVKVAIGVAAVVVGFFVVNLIGWSVYNATGSYAVLALVLPTVPWGLLGWLQWTRLSAAGRRATVVLGLLMPILFVTYVEFVMTSPIFWDPVGIAVITAIQGGIPVVVGLAWTFRR